MASEKVAVKSASESLSQSGGISFNFALVTNYSLAPGKEFGKWEAAAFE